MSVILAAIALLVVGGAGSASAERPVQHESFRRVEIGAGSRSYWLFEPTGPIPERAPVVVFLHGWLATNPGIYGAWIAHLCRRGNVVIFPRYQDDWATSPARYLPNTVAALHDAFEVLELAPGRVRPDRDQVAVLGHSAGGDLAVLLAAAAARSGLPRFRAVVAVMPGEVRPCAGPSPAAIPPATLLVVVVGDLDILVGDARARRLYAGATAVPAENRLFVLYRTDLSGPWPLVADHLAPTAALPALDTGEGPFRQFQMDAARVDALDRFGFWRLADLTLDAAFAGRTLAEVTADGARLRDLGHWASGRPVVRPIVGNDLSAIPRVFPAHGVRLLDWSLFDPLASPLLPRYRRPLDLFGATTGVLGRPPRILSEIPVTGRQPDH